MSANYLHNLIKTEGFPLIENNLKTYSRQDTRYNTINSYLYFRSDSIEELKPLADMFLDEKGTKHCSHQVILQMN